MISNYHCAAHVGIKATNRILQDRFVHPRLKLAVSAFVQSCHACATSKVTRNTKAPLQQLPVPPGRFHTVHVDLVTMESSRGMRYILTMIDRTTRWPEAVPLRSMTADVVARAFIYGWVSRYGVPAQVVSDRGSQFVSALWQNLGNIAGFRPSFTTAYHPQSNGMVERFHRTLKDSLRAQGCNTSGLCLGIKTVSKYGNIHIFVDVTTRDPRVIQFQTEA